MNNKNIVISNDILTVEISRFGAEIQSVYTNNREYIWKGNPDVWDGKAPVLFPICGSLKEDKYIHNNKEFSLSQHGFAKNSIFEVESLKETLVTFLLKSDDNTRKIYPFDFEFRITYILEDKSIKVIYDINNLSNEIMYCSVGAHEGFACPEGIDKYSIIFEKNEFLTTNNLDAPLLVNSYEIIGDNVKELPLKNEYFSIDALILLNLKSRSVKLINQDKTREIEVDFNGFDYLLIWAIPNEKFVCIEPWCGLPDYIGTSFNLSEKYGINKIDINGSLHKEHTITILN